MDDGRKPMANIPPFGLRMQPDLKARVEAAAKAANRSLNAEIVACLEEKYPPQPFNINDFVEEFVVPITEARTLDEKVRLATIANQVLRTGGVRARGLSVVIEDDSEWGPRVVLGFMSPSVKGT